jgi:hypothetical protein
MTAALAGAVLTAFALPATADHHEGAKDGAGKPAGAKMKGSKMAGGSMKGHDMTENLYISRAEQGNKGFFTHTGKHLGMKDYWSCQGEMMAHGGKRSKKMSGKSMDKK